MATGDNLSADFEQSWNVEIEKTVRAGGAARTDGRTDDGLAASKRIYAPNPQERERERERDRGNNFCFLFFRRREGVSTLP